MSKKPSEPLDLDKCFVLALNLVETSGKVLEKEHINRAFMDAVLEIHTIIINGLHEAYPTHIFIAEEIKNENIHITNNPTWVIDPLDGAINFAHGFPHSCISVALINNKVTEFGIIYNPMLNQKFTARRGEGAYLNGKRIMVSGEKDLSKALITTEYGSPMNVERGKIADENLINLIKMVHSVRSLGSGAINLVMVGLGAADANYEMGVHLWDIAAAELIVREAGGIVIDPNGGEFDRMSRRVLGASSIILAQNISKTLSQYYPEPRDD